MKSLKKFLAKKVLTALLILGLLPLSLMGQTVSYDDTISLIVAFEKDKTYSPDTTGTTMDLIFEGIIDNDGVSSSEGLKRRLVGSLTNHKLKLQMEGAPDAADAN